MSELSKFINLLVDYEEKIEAHINKKYKTFIRSLLNVQTLAKSVKPNKIVLTKELIVFKLGLEAKSPKAVEISLNYLLKLIEMKFVDFNNPNLCENYIIEETGVKQVEVPEIKTEVRHQVIDLIKKNIHYKNNDINQLALKILEALISEPILPLLLQLTVQCPQQIASTVLFNYFSFRFYVFEQICFYSQSEINSFAAVTIKSERIQKQITNAIQQNKQLTKLIGLYMNEYLSIIEGDGGRYGKCVMCAEPADHYCKITRASLCGIECKKKHIEMAQKQYKHYFQFVNLWEGIYTSFKELLMFIQVNESPLVFSVLTSLLEKPHLFMVVKHKFRQLLSKHVPAILSKILIYKNQASFQHIYAFIVNLTKHWLHQCLSPVQYFFRQYILKIIQDKKPSFKFINLIFKALARIVQHGKVTVQLYINFDCEVNKQNLIERILFQVAKIVQDRFNSGSHFSKQQRASIKNHCLSLFIIMAMGLNQYRKSEHKTIQIGQIVNLKQKKMSLQQFTIRFNQHWTSGLKTLFNLNLVGLDSNQQIIDIIMNLRGLNKDIIDQLFFCEKGTELLLIFIKKVIHIHQKNVFLGLLDLHHFLPLKLSSLGARKYIQALQIEFEQDRSKQVLYWMQLLTKNFTFQDIKRQLEKQRVYTQAELDQIYIYALQTKQPMTIGNTKSYFTYCCSRSYLQVIASQISLLQIPISYLLESDYETDRILNLIEELIQICSHSNWLSLLIKNSQISKFPTQQFDQIKLRVVLGTLSIIQKQSFFIQDWSTIINFISHLYHILIKVENRQIVQGKVVLSDHLNVGSIERCLTAAGCQSQTYFGKLLLAVLVVGRDQLQRQSLFMIQKFFEMIDANLKKFIRIVTDFLPHLVSFTSQLDKTSPQICISIADMLKQTFAKLLKLPKVGDSWVNDSEAEFWKLFENLCAHKNRQVSDFVVNCISMTILHHYQLGYKSWIVIFAFMKRRVRDYRQQIYTIIEKAVHQKMRNCEQFYSDLVELCLDLIDGQQTKISTQALHCLKLSLQLIYEIKSNSVQCSDGQQKQVVKNQIKTLMLRVIETLIQDLFYQCHQYIIQILFRLVNFKVNGGIMLSGTQTTTVISKVFNKIMHYTPQNLTISQKTINYAMEWSVLYDYTPIVVELQALIIDKYNTLSFSAIVCIKTYIQKMIKSQGKALTQQLWTLILNSLLKILRNTHISSMIDLAIPNQFQRNQNIELQDNLINIDPHAFANRMMAQKNIIQILPNHLQCLQQLKSLFAQVINFNDNIYIRCLLWRKGLGQNSDSPPNLLHLQQIICNKIVSTFNVVKEDELFLFAINIFKRYCSASAHCLHLQEKSKNESDDAKCSQNILLQMSFLKLRRVPLLRVINYFLPKLKKICKYKQQRKQMVMQIIQSCKYVQNREIFIKAIKELSKT